MRRSIVAILTAFLFCVCMPVLAAAMPAGGWIHDNSGMLTAGEIETLNTLAGKIYEEHGFDVLFDMSDGVEGNTQDYAEQRYRELNASTNGVLLVVTPDSWYVHFAGAASEIFTEDDKYHIWRIYNDQPDHSSGIMNYLMEVNVQLALRGAGRQGPVIPDERLKPRLVDGYGLLAEGERLALLAKLDEISERQRFDVAVVTTYSLNGKTSTQYADDFFDYNGYGVGDSRDGILLLISMEERDWAISTHGFGIPAFTDAGQRYLTSQILPDLSAGNYAVAFTHFADLSDKFLTQARTGKPYDIGNMPDDFRLTPRSYLGLLILSLPGGFALAMIATTVAKRRLRTVRLQPTARDYVRKGGVTITDSRDQFLYSQISRTAKATDSGGSGSSGGSSTHTSSSGSSHGGSSGKF